MVFQEYVLLSLFPQLPSTHFLIKAAWVYKQAFIFSFVLGLA